MSNLTMLNDIALLPKSIEYAGEIEIIIAETPKNRRSI